jgi:nicotinamidase-related amidase
MDHERDRRPGPNPALTRSRLRFRPPRSLRATRAGWCFIAIIFGVGFAALNTGNNLLYLVLSLMLAFLVLSGLLSETSLRGIRVKRLLPRELIACSANRVALRIHNDQKRIASFAIVLDDHIETPCAPFRGIGFFSGVWGAMLKGSGRDRNGELTVNGRLATHQQLTDRDDSVLIVVDVQQSFVDKLADDVARPLLNRIRWTVEMAARLGIPVVVTAEDLESVGTTIPFIAEVLPDATIEHDKMTFGLGGDPLILGDVESTGRRTAVLVGFETDVCVMQSTLGLLQQGFRVVVLSDATGSPGECHQAGISRMRDAGAVISTVKGTFYEWVRTLHFADEHLDSEIWSGDRPEGVSL